MANHVRTRRVFYVPGYDPVHPRRYRELYRREAARQAAVSGFDLAMRARPGAGVGWDVTARIEGQETRTAFQVLAWSDIVRDSMATGIAASYAALLRTAWIYLRTGALVRLAALRKGPVLAALYPVATLGAQLVVAALAGLAAAALCGALVAGGASGLAAPPGAAAIIAAFAAAAFTAAFVATLRWFRRRDGIFFAHYLMQDFAFSARWNGAYPPAIEARLAAFGQEIAAALAGEADEVLVVGHSSGVHLAISALADLIRAGKVPAGAPVLSFLSLGQVVPMVSFLPEAHRLRADLHLLGRTSRLAWVDVSAPGDGCAFALCDPVAVSGMAGPGRGGPQILSAAFSRTLRPETWTALRWRFLRLHFQYLCAFDNLPDDPAAYDYFRVTAGPLTLAARFATRASSRGRIDTPRSGHTGMAA